MSAFVRRTLVLGAVFAPVAALALWLSYSDARATVDSNLGARVPMSIGDWEGETKPLSERVYQLLETRDVVFRRYSRGKGFVWLCLVQSQDNRRGSHPPEICYQGQGYEVDRKQVGVLKAGTAGAEEVEVNRLEIQKGQSRWAVLYWYQVGDWQTSSYALQQLRLVGNLLLGRDAPAIVVRFDTPIGSDETLEDANGRLNLFARSALPALRAAVAAGR